MTGFSVPETGSRGGAIFLQPGLEEPALVETAQRFADCLHPPLVLFLEGDLGAGKTTFVRAVLRALGHAGPVKSPTYGLMEIYDLEPGNAAPGPEQSSRSPFRLVHLDLYRIADPDEIEFLGLGDLLDARTVLCIEWPGQGAGALPPPDVTLRLTESSDPGAPARDLHWYAHSGSGIKLCELIHQSL